MKNYKYIGLFLLIIGFASCNVKNELEDIKAGVVPEVQLNTNGLDFSKYVAIGASFTAGFTDGALFKVAQENSFPNILAKKFGVADSFKQPLMNDNIGGLLLGGFAIQEPRLFFDAAAGVPVRLSDKPTSKVSVNVGGSLNNFGVPGAKSFDLLAAGFGNLQGVLTGVANPYFVRMASTPNVTVMDDAMAQNPTFFTLSEIGGNDVLGYALAGGDGVDQSPSASNPTGNLDVSTYDGNDITNPLVFKRVFEGMVARLTSGSAKGVVANVPYVTSLSYFTTVPYNSVPMSATLAAQANAAYAPYNTGIQQAFNTLVTSNLITQEKATKEIAKRTISFSEGKNAVVIVDENLTDLGTISPSFVALKQWRQATASDLLMLTSSSFIGTLADASNPQSVNGVGVPLADKWVLTPEEQVVLKKATDAYNVIIEATAAANANVVMVDFNGLLKQASTSGLVFDEYTLKTNLVTGGLISLDGIHFTARGYALMANKILAAMDTKFGSNFTTATGGLAKAGDYPTNYSPTLK